MKIFVSVPQNGLVATTFFTPEMRAFLDEHFEVVYSPEKRQLLPEELVQYAKDADVLMTGWGHGMINAELLKQTSVKIVAHTGGSVANCVDPDVYPAGIRVISGNPLYAESVAEGTIAYMLLGLRRMHDFVEEVRKGGWQPSFGTEGLLDQTVGIIGMGAISKDLIRMLKPFRVKLKIYSGHEIDKEYLAENNAVQVSLEEVFSTCKIVSLHSALNEKTRGMIGKEHFDLLQDGALFVNTARGAIIREDEMIEALKENRFHAVLDVYCTEPLAEDSPLRSLPNAYCIPHKGGPTQDRRPRVVEALGKDLLRYERGEAMPLEIDPQHAVRMTKER